MRLARLALLLSLLLPPCAASAVEAVLGIDGSTSYNSNVFFQSTNIESDGSARLGPTLFLRDRTGQLTWSLNYRPSYEVFYTLRGIDSTYQLADGRMSWRPSIATEFYATDSFSYTPVRSTTFETNQQALLAQPFLAFTSSEVLQNYFDGGVRHNFTPRLQGELSVNNVLVDYEDQQFADSTSTTAQAFVNYFLDRRNTVGGGFGFTQQSFERAGSSSGGTAYYQIYGLWNHDFSPTWSFRVNAGPTLVSPDPTDFATTQSIPEFSRFIASGNNPVLFPTIPASCPTLNGDLLIGSCQAVYPISAEQAGQLGFQGLGNISNLSFLGAQPSSGGSSITFFANLSMEKRWRWFSVVGAYVRNASSTSGVGQSLITDSFTLTGNWNPSPLWQLTISANYIQRTSSNDQQVPSIVGQQNEAIRVPNCNFLNSNPTCVVNIGGQLFNFSQADAQTLVDGGAAQYDTLPTAQSTGLRNFARTGKTDLSNYGASIQLNRKLTSSSYVYSRFTYTQQNNNSSIQDQISGTSQSASSSVDAYIVSIGFHYEFEPIHFLND